MGVFIFMGKDHLEIKLIAFDLAPFSWSLRIPGTTKDYALAALSRPRAIGHSPHSPRRPAKAVSNLNCLCRDVSSNLWHRSVSQTRQRQRKRKASQTWKRGSPETWAMRSCTWGQPPVSPKRRNYLIFI